MNEAAFSAKFQNWWNTKENGMYPNRLCDCATFEYKVTKGGTFNLNEWRKREPQQEVELTKSSNPEGVIWKISDTDPRVKPFDAFFISNSRAFLIIWFEKHQRFFIIDVGEVPKQTSISFKYCLERWKPYKLPALVRKCYEI